MKTRKKKNQRELSVIIKAYCVKYYRGKLISADKGAFIPPPLMNYSE